MSPRDATAPAHPPEGLGLLADHAARAQAALPPAVWAYLEGGAGAGRTHAANQAAWAERTLLPRVLRPLAGGHTRSALLGRVLAHPIVVAPMALQGLLHPLGERASAQAAAAQGAGFVLGQQASVALEPVAQAVLHETDRGPLWMQLHWQGREATGALARRARDAGYEALVLTVDLPVQAPRDMQARAGFRVPPDAMPMHAAAPVPPPAAGGSTVFDSLMPTAPGWDDVAWLRRDAGLPLLLKGILHPSDALQAAQAGCDGVIVSNHGGRSLDALPATARALPAVVRALQGRLPVLVDGGVRRGTDVLVALALGAQAVLVGRPVAWGLASAGAQGVAHVLRVLRDELEIAMALTGCRTLADVGPELLFS